MMQTKKKKRLQRFSSYFLALAITLSAMGSLSVPVMAQAGEEVWQEEIPQDDIQQDEAQQDAPIAAYLEDGGREIVPLKDAYEGDFYLGCVISPNDLTRNEGEKYKFLKYHFNALTPENATKPDSIWRDPNTSWDTESSGVQATDSMVAQAREDGFYTIGHALAWHNQSTMRPFPAGEPAISYEEAKAQLKTYIDTIAGHFYADEATRFEAWDVVNEAMRDNPENPTDWRNALRHGDLPEERPARWYEAYANGGNGWDYIYDAFVFAREAAPNATLIYNDFNDEEVANKAIAIASMVTELNEKYAQEHPEAEGRKLIEAIGIQGHYNMRLNLGNLEEVLKIYAATGCKIHVTELDVSVNGDVSAGLTEEQEREQAEFYAKLFMLYKKYAGVIDRVTFWGSDDGSSWRGSQRPLLFQRANSGGVREPKEAYWAVADPEGYLGLTKEPPKLDSFTYGGETFDCEGYEFDVNVPEDESTISFSADQASHGYGNEVDVSVSLSDGGAVEDGKPCTATVKIAWVDEPESFTEYRIHFGHMTAEWDPDINYPDSGYRSTVRVRFSDGETTLRLEQKFLEEDGGVDEATSTSAEFAPPPKHESGSFSVATAEQLTGVYLDSVTLKKGLYDADGDLMMGARLSTFTAPESYYKLAAEIEDGKTYILVFSGGKAFTHKAVEDVQMQESDGGTAVKKGYAATEVTIEDDIITEPELIQDNIRFILLPRRGPSGTGHNLLSLVHGGLIQPFIIGRQVIPKADGSIPETVSLHSDKTVGDAELDRAVWFHTGFDPDTHETSLYLKSTIEVEGEDQTVTYVLKEGENGFLAQGGVGTIEDFGGSDDAKLKLYEYVSDHSEVYDVALSGGANGKLSTDVVYAKPNDEVAFRAEPDAGYEIDSLVIRDQAGNKISWSGSNGAYTFVMPASSVEITVSFRIPSGGGGGGGGGGSSNTTTTTSKNEDGSTTKTVTNKKTGTVTETTKWPDGSQMVVETKKDGAITTTETRKDGTKVKTETTAKGETTASVTLPKGSDGAAVTIPTPEKPTAGTVAVLVKDDGSREVVKTSIPVEGGVALKVTESVKLVLLDNAKAFSDMPSGNWAAEATAFVTARELFGGTGADSFSPDMPMSRAMLWTVLARLEGVDTDGGGSWFEQGMAWAKEAGISDGADPEGVISREQLATMLYRYSGADKGDGALDQFADGAEVSAWAADAVAWAVKQGILTGKPGGLLDPQGQATRAEVAVMLMRFITAA